MKIRIEAEFDGDSAAFAADVYQSISDEVLKLKKEALTTGRPYDGHHSGFIKHADGEPAGKWWLKK
jgi:hypothetical protein